MMTTCCDHWMPSVYHNYPTVGFINVGANYYTPIMNFSCCNYRWTF